MTVTKEALEEALWWWAGAIVLTCTCITFSAAWDIGGFGGYGIGILMGGGLRAFLSGKGVPTSHPASRPTVFVDGLAEASLQARAHAEGNQPLHDNEDWRLG